ncbi:hypothetical protein [Natrinema sp. SYSU A 869]|nr:hypothetical protein [Natrinema sp. SYSU A 869]
MRAGTSNATPGGNQMGGFHALKGVEVVNNAVAVIVGGLVSLGIATALGA